MEANMALLKLRPKSDTELHATPREGALTVAEENHLARRWRVLEDRAALGTLVQAHLGLVIRIAQEFRHAGPPMEDLIQEGNLGLMIAARRFDPSKEARLATYATYWIRACMMEHVVRSHGPVRIGTTRSQRKIFFGLGRARRALECEGQAASADALAQALGVERADIDAMTPRLSGRDVSLDAPRNFDDSRQEGAMLAEDRPNPEEIVGGLEEGDYRRQRLLDGLKVLDTRERAIIKARHLCRRPATLAALGKKFGVSRERVRQVEVRAMKKLRAFCSAAAEGTAASAGEARGTVW
jgi:RNA polymerase sigma-32 factor